MTDQEEINCLKEAKVNLDRAFGSINKLLFSNISAYHKEEVQAIKERIEVAHRWSDSLMYALEKRIK